jgi:iron complex outermembrane receptor protein
MGHTGNNRKKMTNRLPLRLAQGASLIAIAALLTATPSFAQEVLAKAAAAPAAAQDERVSADDGTVITVTGIRGGLRRAQKVKQTSTSVVEALSSEDIGKLPESSVADSLGRLAGLAGERRSGRVSGISVRGFREDYVGSTLNGRELIGIGDNRGVEYDLYPTEIIDGAVVYKTPNAGLSAMGIGGTVDLHTIQPLEHKKVLTLNGDVEATSKSNNPDFSNRGHRLALSYSDKFYDDKIGVAITAATTSSPTEDQYSGVWGYSNTAVTSGPNAGKYAPAGIQVTSNSEVLKRDTLAAVIEYKPSDQFTATVDGLYINFSDTGISRGFIEALPIASNGSGVLSSNATTITSATTTGFNSVLRSDPLNKTGRLTVVGANFKYNPSSDVHMTLDLSHSASTKSDARDETYSGLGRAGTSTQGPNNIMTYTYTPDGLQFSNSTQSFDSFNTVKLAGPQSWGGTLAPLGNAPGTPFYNNGSSTVSYAQAQDGFINQALFDEHLDAVRFDIRFSDHVKSKLNQGYFLTASTFPGDGTIPAASQIGTASLAWAGLGNVVAYDAIGLINSDFYIKSNDTQLEPDRAGDTYTIHETILQPFIETEFESSFRNGVRLYGNAGLQVVSTKQTGSGYSSYTGADLFDIAKPIKDSAKYSNLLPSLNVNIDFDGKQTLRFAVAKVISRPRIDSLNPGSAVAFKNNVANVTSTDPVQGPWYSNGGNTQLKPYEANQYDLSYENYFSRDGFVSISVFYKDIVNWNKLSTTIQDYTQFYIPGYDQAVSSDGLTIYTPATFKGVNTTYVGGFKGTVKGAEIQATLPLGDFIPVLDGFGLVGGMAYTDGSLKDGSAIPGLSKFVYQASAFYEKGGFSARVSGNRRSAWLSEDRGGSNTLSPVNRAAETLVDAQIGYDFNKTGIPALKGLKISLQGQNLTNQKDTYTDSTTGLVLRSETFGRTVLLNATYSFY